MKLLILLYLLLNGSAIAYELNQEGDPTPRTAPFYSTNTVELTPGYSRTTIYRDFIPVQQCTTYRNSSGYTSTNCNGF